MIADSDSDTKVGGTRSVYQIIIGRKPYPKLIVVSLFWVVVGSLESGQMSNGHTDEHQYEDEQLWQIK